MDVFSRGHIEIPAGSTDELRLAERLIAFDSSHADGIRESVGYLEGWLESRGIEFSTFTINGDLPVLSASVGEGPITLVMHAHIDVVPGRAEQFSPWQEGGMLWGRGAYDMKGATAAMLAVMADLAELPAVLPVRVRLLIVPDEETDEVREEWGTSKLIERGHVGDFVICGEPTDMYVGVQAKGVLDLRITVEGESAHSATPWLGTNAILRAMDVYDALTRLPFAGESSEYFERASISLSRIAGGDRINKVPEECAMDIDIRFLPEQPIERLREELATLPGCQLRELSWRPPLHVSADNPFVRMLVDASRDTSGRDIGTVGRDGTNDGYHFLQRGIPSVEFGPVGGGHHGPSEFVDIDSLRRYRVALRSFVADVVSHRDELVGQGSTAIIGPIKPASDERAPIGER